MLSTNKKFNSNSTESFLKIIGAGFGRTGTLSLQKALNYLGYNCHHMESVLIDDTQKPDIFSEAYKTKRYKETDWVSAYQNYDAAVDWPTAAFFDTLYELNPDAKVILTIRDPESWYRSVTRTIFEWPGVDETWPEQILNARKMARIIVRDGELALIDDKEAIQEKFLKHIEHVKCIVKPENLLIMQIGDGWEPLCAFLGKDIPKDVPYPHCNKGGNFEMMLQKIRGIVESNNQKKCLNYAYRIKDDYSSLK